MRFVCVATLLPEVYVGRSLVYVVFSKYVQNTMYIAVDFKTLKSNINILIIMYTDTLTIHLWLETMSNQIKFFAKVIYYG